MSCRSIQSLGPVNTVAERPITDRFGGVTSGTQQYRQEPSPTVAVELSALLFLVTSALLDLLEAHSLLQLPVLLRQERQGRYQNSYDIA